MEKMLTRDEIIALEIGSVVWIAYTGHVLRTRVQETWSGQAPIHRKDESTMHCAVFDGSVGGLSDEELDDIYILICCRLRSVLSRKR